MRLPFAPPLAPMLSSAADALPGGEGWQFEPKWDGFRTLVFRDGDEILLQSRDEKPMNRYFPELIAPLAAMLSERCVVDGAGGRWIRTPSPAHARTSNLLLVRRVRVRPGAGNAEGRHPRSVGHQCGRYGQRQARALAYRSAAGRFSHCSLQGRIERAEKQRAVPLGQRSLLV